MQIIFATDGTGHCLYTEAIDLRQLGALQLRRASHVEPSVAGEWMVDLSPVEGPLLGPFACRSQALAHEVAWLETHRLVPNRYPF